MAQKYQVDCWNCDSEGNADPVVEWDYKRCSHCKGKGFLIVTELTDDSRENAIEILEPQP